VTGPPEFRDLVGDELPAEERARLERVHELLVEAGPPPELPPSLAEVPRRGAQSPSWLPRRRLGAALSLAAAIALLAFLGGYVAGFRHNDFEKTREVAMHGTSGAPTARASIKLGKQDDAGNWPMVVTVQGLPRLPERGYYELFVTRNGKFLRCGSFNVEAGTTNVEFTVPYTFEPNDGWIVTRWRRGEREPGPALLKT
jgi:hypothetical protein